MLNNDLGKIEEDNARYSAYILFLTIHFKKYENYIKTGSIALNTLMLYHQSFQYKNEADVFYNEFEKKVLSNLSENDSEKIGI